MYVCGGDKNLVQAWVDKVHELRYKDYQLAAGVQTVTDGKQPTKSAVEIGILKEVETVKEMAAIMESTGQREWWRRAMGFTGCSDD